MIFFMLLLLETLILKHRILIKSVYISGSMIFDVGWIKTPDVVSVFYKKFRKILFLFVSLENTGQILTEKLVIH